MSLEAIFEYPEWESITHGATLALYVYVIYLLITNPLERDVTNLTLLIIAMSIGILVHQNINTRNGVRPMYA